MKVAIVKYNAGNVRSVLFALERLGVSPDWTDDPEAIRQADRVIFPGVGEAKNAMEYLRERKLDRLICSLEQPVLGICLGLQLMCAYSEENDTECLGIFEEKVRRFQIEEKVPHMGWNLLEESRGPLFHNLPSESYLYFVHSYYAEVQKDTIAITHYGHRFSAALQRENFHGVQFHPEKSGIVGEQILQNFLEITDV
jgi:glutamine amidotransferase